MPTEHLDVVPVQLGRLLVQGVIGVRLVEEVDQAVDDGVDVEDRLPVLAQNVQAEVILEGGMQGTQCISRQMLRKVQLPVQKFHK